MTDYADDGLGLQSRRRGIVEGEAAGDARVGAGSAARTPPSRAVAVRQPRRVACGH